MSYLTDDQRKTKLDEKAAVVEEWLEWIEQQYAELISRAAETGALSGFDNLPDSRPCEHRPKWMKGNLCLACDNTNWRRATKLEKEEGIALDPYAADLPKSRVNIRESEASRYAMEAARLDAIIATLDRNARVRSGKDILEDRELRNFRIVTCRPRNATFVIATLRRIRDHGFDQFLDRRELCLLIAALIGRKLTPPRFSVR